MPANNPVRHADRRIQNQADHGERCSKAALAYSLRCGSYPRPMSCRCVHRGDAHRPLESAMRFWALDLNAWPDHFTLGICRVDRPPSILTMLLCRHTRPLGVVIDPWTPRSVPGGQPARRTSVETLMRALKASMNAIARLLPQNTDI